MANKSDEINELNLLEQFTVSRRVALEWTAFSSIGFVAALFVFGGLYTEFTNQTGYFSLTIGAENAASQIGIGVLIFGLTFGVIVIHELIHGAVMKQFGANPRYGFGVAQFVLPYAYATSDESLTRNQFLVVAIAPLVVLTIVLFTLAIIFQWPILLAPLAVNAGGAVGDLLMTRLLLRYPKTIRVVDNITGLKIYGDTRAIRSVEPRHEVLHGMIVGIGITIGSAFLLMMIAPIVLDNLGVTSFTLGIPDSLWSLYHFEKNAEGINSEVGMVGLLGVGTILGVCYSIVVRKSVDNN
ncbi:DUF3267 domain-containing protein [Haladaptatus sp. CMAA 1911]|uniref:DUF3267 domain-containing protein n=1 Tax=unclassified Haladaptatus TaxID=2622732 RepID=UPI003754FA30